MLTNLSHLVYDEKEFAAVLYAERFDDDDDDDGDVPTQWFPEFDDPFFLAIEKELYAIVNHYNTWGAGDSALYDETVAKIEDLINVCVIDPPGAYID